MEVPIYDTAGKATKRHATLPDTFTDPVRIDLIRRAVKAARANRRQPYGPGARAGMRHAVSWPGKGRGMARTPRTNHGSGRGAEAPNTVGGRRAHPPKTTRQWHEKINRRERRKAFRSALAATADADTVRGRGHRLPESITLPLVVEARAEKLVQKSSDTPPVRRARQMLDGLGLYDDLTRARRGRHVRAGRGKLRGRRYRTPRSVLLVLSELNGTERAFRNLPGVDITTAHQLNTALLAPGGDPGRLVVFTEPALAALEARL